MFLISKEKKKKNLRPRILLLIQTLISAILSFNYNRKSSPYLNYSETKIKKTLAPQVIL